MLTHEESGAGEVFQQLRSLAGKPDDLSSVPGTRILASSPAFFFLKTGSGAAKAVFKLPISELLVTFVTLEQASSNKGQKREDTLKAELTTALQRGDWQGRHSRQPG